MRIETWRWIGLAFLVLIMIMMGMIVFKVMTLPKDPCGLCQELYNMTCVNLQRL